MLDIWLVAECRYWLFVCGYVVVGFYYLSRIVRIADACRMRLLGPTATVLPSARVCPLISFHGRIVPLRRVHRIAVRRCYPCVVVGLAAGRCGVRYVAYEHNIFYVWSAVQEADVEAHS